MSCLLRPPPTAVFGMLKAFFDDSGDDIDPQHKVCTLAGYVGTCAQWDEFEYGWRAVLKRHGLPYLHMKDFNAYRGPFERLRSQRLFRARFLSDLVEVVRLSRLRGLASMVRLVDLRGLSADRDVSIDAFAFNLYICAVQMAVLWPETSIEVWIDRITNPTMRVAQAELYAKTDPLHSKAWEFLTVAPLGKGKTFRDKPPLQVADFLAWEARKDIDTKHVWFSREHPTEDYKAYRRELRDWSASQNIPYPYGRKSLAALVMKTGVYGHAWHKETLSYLDKARNGVWPTLRSEITP